MTEQEQTQEQSKHLPINFVYADRDVGKDKDMYVLIICKGCKDKETGNYKQDCLVFMHDENADNELKNHLDIKDSGLVKELFKQGKLRLLSEAELASFERKTGKSGLIRAIPELEN